MRNTIKSRYQGTVLGWLWSYLQPAIRFCMFYFLFQVMIGRGAAWRTSRSTCSPGW